MEKLENLLTELNLESNITLDDIPNLDLYMDQVIQLFENKFGPTKRNEDEKILTKTMINNYAKGKLFFPIKNKKYSKEHLLFISLIFQLKGSLSINDIKMVLEKLNDKVVKESFNLEEFYSSYLQITEKDAAHFKVAIKEKVEDAEQEIEKLGDKDSTYLEKVLLIASLAYMSNLYRRAAELLADEIVKEGKPT